MRSILVLALGFAVLSCTDKSAEERCTELADYLEGRETSLPRECETHEDCEVVYVRPDRPIAATYQPRDDELERAVLSYRQNCGPLPYAEGELWAECVERFVEVVNPEGSGALEESVGRSCVLRGEYTVPGTESDVSDTGDADGGQDAFCACVSATECGAGELCHACECIPGTLCGEACIAADRCGALIDLGLGTSASVCASGCDAAVEANTSDFGTFAECLRSRTCDEIGGCALLVP
jgi:hypothetical protein